MRPVLPYHNYLFACDTSKLAISSKLLNMLLLFKNLYIQTTLLLYGFSLVTNIL